MTQRWLNVISISAGHAPNGQSSNQSSSHTQYQQLGYQLRPKRHLLLRFCLLLATLAVIKFLLTYLLDPRL